MAKSYKITEIGVSDLKEIWEHIAELNYEAANRTIKKLSQKFDLLAENPQLGKSQDNYVINLRSFPYKKYVIFYFPIEDGVEIYRVFHGARNIEDLFETFFEGLKP